MTTNTIDKLVNNTGLLTDDDLPQTAADWEKLAEALFENYNAAKNSTNPAVAAAVQKWNDMNKSNEMHANDPLPVFPGFEAALDDDEDDIPVTAEQHHSPIYQQIYGNISNLESFIEHAEF